jgi:hypothetical protein
MEVGQIQPSWPMAVARGLSAAVRLLQPPSATVVGHDVGPTAVGHSSWTCNRRGPHRGWLVVRIDEF